MCGTLERRRRAKELDPGRFITLISQYFKGLSVCFPTAPCHGRNESVYTVFKSNPK